MEAVRQRPLGIARFRSEAIAAYAFIERNFYLTKRYWGWEIAFVIYTLASSMSVIYIGKAQGGQNSQELILYLGIGTLVWSYLNSVFSNISEMITWERWEGTIEFTMMAPISRLTHMLGVSLFAIIYGILRTALFLGALAIFFDISVTNANLVGALLVILLGSLSFIGFGIMAAVLPLLFTERGEQMTFIISSILLLVSGVYYPISVLPGWMQFLSHASPATYVLTGMRSTVLDGASISSIFGSLWPMTLIGLVTIPLGMFVFISVERYAKRIGRLKRNG